MTGRREFLIAGIGTLGAGAARAREVVRRGNIGRVAYCRVEHAGLIEAAAMIAGYGCVIEVEMATRGLAVLGSRGTLVVNGAGCRLFPANS